MDREEINQKLIRFFDIDVLAGYRNRSDRYEVTTDYFEGAVKIRSDYYEAAEAAGKSPGNVDIQFGYHSMKNGDLAVAAYLPDIGKAPEEEQRKWMGHELDPAQLAEGPDERFDLFFERYFEGNWDVEDGVLSKLVDVVQGINALSEMTIGEALFEHEESGVLAFPSGENDHRYQDAHRDVYGYLIDGLRKEGVSALADHLGIEIAIGSNRTLKALEKVLPDQLATAVLASFESVSEQRRHASHSVRPPAQPFPAFERFSRDMDSVLTRLSDLQKHLSEVLDATVDSAKNRRRALRTMPRLDSEREVSPHFSVNELTKLAGRTIKNVQSGFREQVSGVHDSELIVLEFTDGTVATIDTGSNVVNLTEDVPSLSAEDFHVNYRISIAHPLVPIHRKDDATE